MRISARPHLACIGDGRAHGLYVAAGLCVVRPYLSLEAGYTVARPVLDALILGRDLVTRSVIDATLSVVDVVAWVDAVASISTMIVWAYSAASEQAVC